MFFKVTIWANKNYITTLGIKLLVTTLFLALPC